MDQDNRRYEASSGSQVFPQSAVLLLLDRTRNTLALHLMSRQYSTDYDERRYDLISAVPISEFQPYFMLYEEELQIFLNAEIIKLIAKAGVLARRYRKAVENPLPSALKRLARKLVRCLRRWLEVGGLTQVFIAKIYAMVRQIWRDLLLYYCFIEQAQQLRSRLQSMKPVEAFRFEC